MTIYTAEAFRWGYTNGHRYMLYVGTDQTKAIAMANSENSDRGGKYATEVREWSENGEESKQIAYYPSTWGEDEGPYHNHRIDMFESLGHVMHRFGSSGKVYVPDPDAQHEGQLKEVTVEIPDWAKREIERAEKICEMFQEAAEKRAEERKKAQEQTESKPSE